MIVSSSNLTLNAHHEKSQSSTERESLELYKSTDKGIEAVRVERASVYVSLSQEASRLSEQVGRADDQLNKRFVDSPAVTKSDPTAPVGDAEEAPMEPRMRLAKSIIESITGKKIELSDGRLIEQRLTELSGAAEGDSQELEISAESQPQFGMNYQLHRTYEEHEAMAFSAEGQILTADGKRIDINLQMEMVRNYQSSESLEIREGVQLKDPLVINFSGNATELTDQKFGFDLDSDGQQEQINFVKPNSGLLALDKNGDGQINNGKELFGAQTGQGFKELAQYDEDQNGFIDEADSVYSQLKIWVKTAEGEDQQFSLKEKDVGAIYLGAVLTPFELKNSENEKQGEVRSSSIYLHEDGLAGSVQQIDLVV